MIAYNIVYECNKQMHIEKVIVVTSNLEIAIKDIQKEGTIKSVQMMGEVKIYE